MFRRRLRQPIRGIRGMNVLPSGASWFIARAMRIPASDQPEERSCPDS